MFPKYKFCPLCWELLCGCPRRSLARSSQVNPPCLVRILLRLLCQGLLHHYIQKCRPVGIKVIVANSEWKWFVVFLTVYKNLKIAITKWYCGQNRDMCLPLHFLSNIQCAYLLHTPVPCLEHWPWQAWPFRAHLGPARADQCHPLPVSVHNPPWRSVVRNLLQIKSCKR